MWRITWRDLVFRRRRFMIAAAATALVFAVTLLLSGVLVAVENQNRRIVASFGADGWWVPEGASGPFTAGPAIGLDAAAALASTPGVTRADPVLILHATATRDDDITDVNLVGIPSGGLGSPTVSDGRAIAGPGEAVVDSELGYDVGEQIVVGGRPFAVVGTASQVTYLFGIPTIFLSLGDAQAVGAGGQPVASAVVTQGVPKTPPVGLQRLSDDAVVADLERLLERGLQSIDLIRSILLITALGIVGLIVYLSSLERAGDVAVLKATGATDPFIGAGLAIQGVVVTLAAAVVAAFLANLIAPGFPIALELTVDVYVQLLGFAIVVGLLASLAGVRRALAVDPALAFG